MSTAAIDAGADLDGDPGADLDADVGSDRDSGVGADISADVDAGVGAARSAAPPWEMTPERDATVEVVVGRVGRAHGIKGEVAVSLLTDEPDRRFALGAVVASARGPLVVASARWHGTRFIVRFADASDRSAAEALRGLELRLAVPATETPADPDEFYDHQLVGLTIVSPSGAELGVIAQVLHLPAQDVLVVDRGDAREVLVPFVEAIVTDVDLAARRAVVRDEAGLFEA